MVVRRPITVDIAGEWGSVIGDGGENGREDGGERLVPAVDNDEKMESNIFCTAAQEYQEV